ncbi:MAG: efflux RND transporter periplasmic adaptor subunit [Planctomycetes bacterium]|nr:efflux RND transporter periplasmic adaptor subunit [Planctomycetota bacterium]
MISRRLFLVAIVIAFGAGAGVVGLALRPRSSGASTSATGPTLYYCPMHPSYRSDRAGDCPICNMKLVPLGSAKTLPMASGIEGHATVTIDPEHRRLIGIRTSLVEKKRATRTLRAAGRLEVDERKLATVSLKFSGWIEEMRVTSVGGLVKRGDPLFVVYSPDLLEAQRNFLKARETPASATPSSTGGVFATERLRTARERLLLWDLTEDQVRALEASGKPEAAVTMLAKVSGVVTRRAAVQGSFVEAGKEIVDVADLSSLWVLADVYANEAPLVAVGCDATIALDSQPGNSFAGKVDTVYPFVDPATRTARVRIQVPNPDGVLRPGTYATVSIAIDLGEQLVVDDGAVLDTGSRQIVFVDDGDGRFEPREVTIGERSDGIAVVRTGLAVGERVVTSGNFLIDSESRLRAALGGDTHTGDR